MESLITDKTGICFACGSKRNVRGHNIYYGYGRENISLKHKLTVPLCLFHHTKGKGAVHNSGGKKLDLEFKKIGQKAFENQIGSRDEFIREFGRSYL